MVTMDELYGNGSDHEVCQKCGECFECDDCECGFSLVENLTEDEVEEELEEVNEALEKLDIEADN